MYFLRRVLNISSSALAVWSRIARGGAEKLVLGQPIFDRTLLRMPHKPLNVGRSRFSHLGVP